MKKNKKYCYEYPRPSVSADCVVIGFDGEKLNVLLIQRKKDPFKNKWAIPGGFVEMNENTEEGTKRELQEETGIKKITVEQLYTFSDVNRDPRGRVISVVYLAFTKTDQLNPKAGDDAKNVKWIELKKIPSLAFDHKKILQKAMERLKEKCKLDILKVELRKKKFTLIEIKNI